MKIHIEIDENHLKKLVIEYLRNYLGETATFKEEEVVIQTKSKQNYRSEWEQAAFRAVLDKDVKL